MRVRDSRLAKFMRPREKTCVPILVILRFRELLIKDDLIDTLDFRSKFEIMISDILILPVCFLKVKPKVNKKSGETRPVSLLICFQMGTQYKNLKYPI